MNDKPLVNKSNISNNYEYYEEIIHDIILHHALIKTLD